VPSKTFHFGPDLRNDLEDLFECHLVLAALLEASASIVASPPPTPEQVSLAIGRADVLWIRFFRVHLSRGITARGPTREPTLSRRG